MASTNDFRNGAVIKIDGDLLRIESYEHRTPGNLRAFVQAKLRNLRTGNLKEVRFRSGEEVEMIRMEKRPYQYLYKEGQDFVFMDNESYEQLTVPDTTVGDVALYIRESDNVDIVNAEDGTIVAACCDTYHSSNRSRYERRYSYRRYKTCYA
jgi:elongation factor P